MAHARVQTNKYSQQFQTLSQYRINCTPAFKQPLNLSPDPLFLIKIKHSTLTRRRKISSASAYPPPYDIFSTHAAQLERRSQYLLVRPFIYLPSLAQWCNYSRCSLNKSKIPANDRCFFSLSLSVSRKMEN